jgi:hypothetical protein
MQADGNFTYLAAAGSAYSEMFTVTVTNGTESAQVNLFFNVNLPANPVRNLSNNDGLYGWARPENMSSKVVIGPLSNLPQTNTDPGPNKSSTFFMGIEQLLVTGPRRRASREPGKGQNDAQNGDDPAAMIILGSLVRAGKARIVGMNGPGPANHTPHHLLSISQTADLAVMEYLVELGYNTNRANDIVWLPNDSDLAQQLNLPYHPPGGTHSAEYYSAVRQALVEFDTRYRNGLAGRGPALTDAQIWDTITSIENNIYERLIRNELKLNSRYDWYAGREPLPRVQGVIQMPGATPATPVPIELVTPFPLASNPYTRVTPPTLTFHPLSLPSQHPLSLPWQRTGMNDGLRLTNNQLSGNVIRPMMGQGNGITGGMSIPIAAAGPVGVVRVNGYVLAIATPGAIVTNASPVPLLPGNNVVTITLPTQSAQRVNRADLVRAIPANFRPGNVTSSRNGDTTTITISILTPVEQEVQAQNQAAIAIQVNSAMHLGVVISAAIAPFFVTPGHRNPDGTITGPSLNRRPVSETYSDMAAAAVSRRENINFDEARIINGRYGTVQGMNGLLAELSRLNNGPVLQRTETFRSTSGTIYGRWNRMGFLNIKFPESWELETTTVTRTRYLPQFANPSNINAQVLNSLLSLTNSLSDDQQDEFWRDVRHSIETTLRTHHETDQQQQLRMRAIAAVELIEAELRRRQRDTDATGEGGDW